jgi:hypothetical protein
LTFSRESNLEFYEKSGPHSRYYLLSPEWSHHYHLQTKTVSNLKRYKEIGDVLLKWGFGTTLLEDLSPGLARMNLQGRLHPNIAGMSVYERMRHVLEELGPTFVKFGQILSTRRELIPPEMFEELAKLQAKLRSKNPLKNQDFSSCSPAQLPSFQFYPGHFPRGILAKPGVINGM